MIRDCVPAEQFHPSEFIREEMTERRWSVEQFAILLEMKPGIAQMLVDGDKRVTRLVAVRIGKAFGTSWQLWWRLQKAHDVWKRDVAERTSDG